MNRNLHLDRNLFIDRSRHRPLDLAGNLLLDPALLHYRDLLIDVGHLLAAAAVVSGIAAAAIGAVGAAAGRVATIVAIVGRIAAIPAAVAIAAVATAIVATAAIRTTSVATMSKCLDGYCRPDGDAAHRYQNQQTLQH